MMAVLLMGVTVVAEAVNTQVQTDNSLLGITTLNLDEPGSNQVYTLSEVNGKASGNNLFYSFSHFNIGATDTAWFNLNTPGLANVISRVTGGSQSFIDGQLKMTNEAGGVPSFFFINPAGITFGVGASVDVPGSFYVSTASHLNFSDGTQYHADGTHASTLSSASPEAFGFLGNETGNLNLVGSDDSNRTDLSFKPEAVVALVANKIHIDNATVTNAANKQAGIDLQLIGTGNEAINIKLDSLPDQATVGDLTISNTNLDASGNGSGSITIRAGNTTVTNSEVYASNMGSSSMTTSDGVNVLTNSLSMENSKLKSKALSSGNGGSVNVMAVQALTLKNGAQIATEAYSLGNGGTVSVSAKAVDIDGFKKPSSISSLTFGEGSAGAVTVNADSVKVANSGIIYSWTGSTGNAGDMNILTDLLQLTRMGLVSSSTSGSGNSGDITVQARQILFDGQHIENVYTGIVNQIWKTGTGNAGSTTVIAKEINLLDGGLITSYSGGSGAAGAVSVNTEQLEVDGKGIYTGVTSVAGNKGDANIVTVTADAITLLNGGEIHASTFGEGNAGEVIVEAGEIYINSQGAKLSTGIFSSAQEKSGQAGKVKVSADSLILTNGGMVGASSNSIGSAGKVEVIVDQLRIDDNLDSDGTTSGIYAEATKSSAGAGGAILVTANSLAMNDGAISVGTFGGRSSIGVTVNANILEMSSGARISSSTWGSGDAGFTTVNAATLLVDNKDNNQFRGSGIFSNANKGTGNAGPVTVTADYIGLTDGGSIASSTFSQGNAGKVMVDARQIVIDDRNNELFTGITTNTGVSDGGQAGDIIIKADKLTLTNNGDISSESRGNGNAGNIDIDVNVLSMQKGATISTGATSTGDAGSIALTAANMNLSESNISSRSTSSGVDAGSAGSVTLDTGHNGNIFLERMKIDTNVSGGQAGDHVANIDLRSGLLTASDSTISASTQGETDAGKIFVSAKNSFQLKDRSFLITDSSGAGDAGQIMVSADNIGIDTGSYISSSTRSTGSAGRISVAAITDITLQGGGSIPIDQLGQYAANEFTGIRGLAEAGSSGQSGAIDISAGHTTTLSNGAQISISNQATVAEPALLAPTSINIRTPSLSLTGSQIVADSSGNVGAGNITISFKDRLYLDPSAISTRANDGHGGTININGEGLVYLQNSEVTTSVFGQTGNGGDINMFANYLIMDSGFVQANTKASGASGGRVNVNVPTIVPSGSTLFVGGDKSLDFKPFTGLNVIQAAAPSGISGTVNASVPQLNLSGMLANLFIEPFDPNTLNRNMCTADEGSFLLQSGKGGQRLRARDFLLLPM